MSPNLKPLMLPQLVEQRKKLEVQRTVASDGEPIEQTIIYYPQPSSSSSDLALPSPVTPTFSRSGHSRYSGSTSSLEQLPPSLSDSPASPTQVTAHNATKNSLSQLPDVQEDPLREEEDTTLLAGAAGLYNCLCDEPCNHHEPDLVETPLHIFAADMDHDLGFLSDSDFYPGSPLSNKKKRNGFESPFTGWSRQIGARLPTLPRWKSASKRANPTKSPVSEPSLDRRPSLSRTASRATSSRSSSISAIGRRILDRSHEPPLPPTPALSLYESTDSVALPAPIDIEKANAVEDIERDRAMATTPLLPPLLTEASPTSLPTSLQPSPLQSPTVAISPFAEALSPPAYATPPLSSKPSVSSFRHVQGMTLSPVITPVSETPSPIPNLIEHDEWSDRLGHANFTILPRPYQPKRTNLEALSMLRADWDLARINYTKHLVRTGEHYGTTSNTYSLTQAKWAEVERGWHKIEEDLIDRIVQSAGSLNNGGGDDEASATSLTLLPQLLRRRRGHSEVAQPAAIPKMLEAEGKFPERGDVDIVGPMQRDAVMIRDWPEAVDDKKNVGAWLKTLAGKVGLRK